MGEYRLLTGLEPTKVPLPGAEGCWVTIRKLNRRERRHYAQLNRDDKTVEAADYLPRTAVVDFLLPSMGSGPIRANPDDPDKRIEQLDDASDELEMWLMEQCYLVNGEPKRARLLRMAQEGIVLTAEVVKQVMDEPDGREEELGNSGSSPALSGEASSEPSDE